MIRLFIFDLDGVLASTTKEHFDAWKLLIKKHFDVTVDDAVEVQTKGVSREESLRRILAHHNLEADEKTFNKIAHEKNEVYKELVSQFDENNLFPGVIELFEYLKQNNIKIALGSASKNGPTIVRNLGIIDMIDYIVDPSKVRGKPFPDIFKEAQFRFILRPEQCVGVEDAVAGIKAINSAGMYSIGIGHKKELHEADLVVPSIKKLLDEDLDAIIHYQPEEEF